jgi:alkylhydroperoxidase/carboxymuconolactone decarboxylase family protein YurZ
MSDLPKHFKKMQDRYGDVMKKMKELGEATDKAGPIDAKAAHLIQIAAAAAMRSEGAVHSHARRAAKAGVSHEEIRHAVVLTLPTIGYPNMAAAMSWVDDVLD